MSLQGTRMNFIYMTVHVVSCGIAKTYDLTRGSNKTMQREQSSKNLELIKKLISWWQESSQLDINKKLSELLLE